MGALKIKGKQKSKEKKDACNGEAEKRVSTVDPDSVRKFKVTAGECSFEGSYLVGQDLYEGELSTWNELGGYAPMGISALIDEINFEIKLLEEAEEEYGEDNSEQVDELRQLIEGLIEVARDNL